MITPIIILIINLWLHQDQWPSSVWYRYAHPYHPYYQLKDLYGWQHINYLTDFWYTQPISYLEFRNRLEQCNWLASRDLALQFHVYNSPPQQPIRPLYQTSQPFSHPRQYLLYWNICFWTWFWQFYASFCFTKCEQNNF